MSKRIAIYDRPCPFTEQNTLQAMRDYANARDSSEIIEYMESKGKGQPALNNLLRDAKARKFDVVLCHSLLAIGNSLKQLLAVMEKLRGMGIEFISLSDGLHPDSSSEVLLKSLSYFQRGLVSSKIRLSLELCRMRNVLLGRKPLPSEKVAEVIEARQGNRSVRDVARLTKVPKSTCWRVIREYEKGQSVAV